MYGTGHGDALIKYLCANRGYSCYRLSATLKGKIKSSKLSVLALTTCLNKFNVCWLTKYPNESECINRTVRTMLQTPLLLVSLENTN